MIGFSLVKIPNSGTLKKRKSSIATNGLIFSIWMPSVIEFCPISDLHSLDLSQGHKTF